MRKRPTIHDDLPRIVCVFDEIAPFLAETQVGICADLIVSKIAKYNISIRTFTPKWGLIKERRYQLHEVIRLTGLNIIFDDMDHLLTVKASSLPRARAQIYFISNKEYFERTGLITTPEGEQYSDNHERIIFFAKSVIKSVERLQWMTSYLHVGGTFSSFLPLFVKGPLKDSPHFAGCKVVLSLFDEPFKGEINSDLVRLLQQEGIAEDFGSFLPLNWVNCMKLAIKHSDVVVFHSDKAKELFKDYVVSQRKKFYDFPSLDNFNYEMELIFLLNELGYIPLPEEYQGLKPSKEVRSSEQRKIVSEEM